jgi:hypothetical protein
MFVKEKLTLDMFKYEFEYVCQGKINFRHVQIGILLIVEWKNKNICDY